MNSEEFRIRGKEIVDISANYLDTVEDRRVLPNVKPGFLRDLIPKEAPSKPDQWKDLIDDIERVIMPGVTHWKSPHFHAYYPITNSYAAICADILIESIGTVGFTWESSPAATELEVVMMDWLAKLLKLPDFYLSTSNGQGGGVLQSSASDAILLAMLSARFKTIQEVKKINPEWSDHHIASKLVAYVSEQVHSCGDKAAKMAMVTCRFLPVDDKFSLRGDTFEKQVEKDKEDGLIPFFLGATLGTTAICSFDNLTELGPVCQKNNIWMHIDAAYAGSSFICEEFRHLLNGVEYSDSFNFNLHYWMLMNLDCSPFWVRNKNNLIDAFNVERIFLKHKYQNFAPDFRHWQIPLSRRFRSLKVWFVLRLYGVEKLQEHIRYDVSLAKYFQSLVLNDNRFEIFGEVTLGTVCFRIKGSNELNQALLEKVNENGKIYIVPGKIGESYFIRFVICSPSTKKEHIDIAWDDITNTATTILSSN